MVKRTLFLLFSAATGSLVAHAQDVKLDISEAGFSRELVETLVSEYNSSSEGRHIVLTNGDGDGRIVLREQGEGSIGRFVVLPIANAGNPFVASGKARKGLNQKLERQIFIERDELADLGSDYAPKELNAGTVFSLAGRKALTSQLEARNLNAPQVSIKGKKIFGSDVSAINAVKKNTDGIGFNIPSLIYNKESRRPESGLAILNVDLDGDGKVTDEERAAILDIDSLVAFLEDSRSIGRPIGNVTIDTNDDVLSNFVDWVAASGQGHVNRCGFLRAAPRLTANK